MNLKPQDVMVALKLCSYPAGRPAMSIVAADLGLSPEVLATRRDLEQLADGRQDVSVLKGWRRGVIGDRMLAAL